MLCILFIGPFFTASYANETVQHTTDDLDKVSPLVEYTELEFEIVQASGFLSLAQQVKFTAQRLIALSTEKPESIESTSAEAPVMINHAQHFAIAKGLAKSWTEEVWQQRLLALVHTLPVETQIRLQQQLSQPMLQKAQQKEQAAIALQHSPEYQLYMNKLRQRPPAASRWQLVESLDKQSGFSAMVIQARTAAIKAISLQVEGWQPNEFWQNQARQEVLEFLFYAYRKTPNAQLKHIANSFNQPEIKTLFTTVSNGM
jgi:hypothetical protein